MATMEENHETKFDWHDDEISTDVSQVQGEYEAALGAFLVTFNGLENTINEIIYLATQKVRTAGHPEAAAE